MPYFQTGDRVVLAQQHLQKEPVLIQTLQGKMPVNPGDWIITDVDGSQRVVRDEDLLRDGALFHDLDAISA